jgi:hypothetical protein
MLVLVNRTILRCYPFMINHFFGVRFFQKHNNFSRIKCRHILRKSSICFNQMVQSTIWTQISNLINIQFILIFFPFLRFFKVRHIIDENFVKLNCVLETRKVLAYQLVLKYPTTKLLLDSFAPVNLGYEIVPITLFINRNIIHLRVLNIVTHSFQTYFLRMGVLENNVILFFGHLFAYLVLRVDHVMKNNIIFDIFIKILFFHLKHCHVLCLWDHFNIYKGRWVSDERHLIGNSRCTGSRVDSSGTSSHSFGVVSLEHIIETSKTHLIIWSFFVLVFGTNLFGDSCKYVSNFLSGDTNNFLDILVLNHVFL